LRRKRLAWPSRTWKEKEAGRVKEEKEKEEKEEKK